MFRTLLAAALTLAFTSSASAAPIATIDGISGSVTLDSYTVTTYSLSFAPAGLFATNTAVTMENGAVLALPLATTLQNFTLNRAGTSVTGGTLYTFAAAVGTPGQTIFDTGTTGPSAKFNLLGLTAFVPNGNTNAMILNLTIILAPGSNSALDYSPFNTGGLGTFTFNASPGTNLNTAITGGTTIPGSASFSEITANLVPEPATIATLGLMGLFGGYFARRKLKAGSVAQA